jgi:GH15 family glucan-1,4-alpha-glucosidase
MSAARARVIRAAIETKAWNAERGCFVSAFGGASLDASLLQLSEIELIDAQDPRFVQTVSAIESELKRGSHLLRYAEADDFGMPQTAFTICTFWYIQALAGCGRREEARKLFEELLERRTNAGLLSEDIAADTGELRGNYPQTYSLVGIIACATALSGPWSSVR